MRSRHDNGAARGTAAATGRSTCMEDRTLIERLARHLAAMNPDGWPDRVEDAASILAILKEPDAAMRTVGDVEAWGAMIDAALRERWSLGHAGGGMEPPGGTDEEGDMRLTPDAVSSDRADWIHLHHGQEKSS
ncbi:hypothetical protein C100_19480 [Sphingobium sp. C100]|nr:hypothetical protein C100_19480 [Sphingobium sp. C100]